MSAISISLGWFLLLAGFADQPEITATFEANGETVASGEFKFRNIPAPTRNDAASNATFTLVDGRRDPNSGDLKVLHDGKVPAEPDQPGRNFFLAQGQDGGRLTIDLRKVIEVKQVNTYSWHPGTRGPQVYKLYAADGSARDFHAVPKKDIAPEKCGWQFVADVDTRPKIDHVGGQYGVSISGHSGRSIGKYRYLLLDVFATEKRDPFGNTFFSEIDVIDAAVPERLDAAVSREISKSPDSAPYQITIDYGETPELKDWVKKKLQPTVDRWYPRIVEALPSQGYTAPKRFTITISQDYCGVAATRGTDVVCSAEWFRKNRDGEATGAVIHELVHVVQQYRQFRGGKPNPGWLVEGVADYIRWFKFEPSPTGTRPRNPDKAKYTDSYRTTAGFLDFVVKKHDQQIVAKLNAAMRQGKYSDGLWKQFTGKTVDDLWAAYAATLKN